MSTDSVDFTEDEFELALALAGMLHRLPHGCARSPCPACSQALSGQARESAANETARRLLEAKLLEWVESLRAFRPTERASALLVALTTLGIEALRARGPNAPVGVQASGPHWDGTFLWYDRQEIMSFRKDAFAQRELLDAFQHANWARSIPAPGESTKDATRARQQRLYELNKGQEPPRIRFRSNGACLSWELVEE